MSDMQIKPLNDANRNRTIFLVICVYLIGSFLWRVLTPAHEYNSETLAVVNVGIDALIVAGLISLKALRAKYAVLFWLALLAGLGLFAIRLNGEASWLTGHLNYTLSD